MGSVWLEVVGVCVYSCYFSVNDPFEILEIQILLLEEGEALEEARLDRRGILVGERVARNDLIVLNRGRDFTCRRGAERGGSFIDLAIAAPRLASRIGDWCVFKVITLSGHECIEFSIQEWSYLVNAQGKYSAGDRRGAKRGDRGIPGIPPGSLQLLSSGGEVHRRLEEAEVGPAKEGQQTSKGCLIV